MKVCLLISPLVTNDKMKSYFSYPLGVLYVGAKAREEGYDVKVIDKNIELGSIIREEIKDTVEAIKNDLVNVDMDVLGICVSFSVNERFMNDLGAVLKDSLDFTIVFGGANSSVRVIETLRKSRADFVVIGEGEITFSELLRAIESGQDFRSVKGLAYYDCDSLIITKSRPYITDLDSIPFPARDLLDMEKYFFEFGKGRSSGRSDYVERQVSMISSRGCIHDCIFCSIHLTMGCFYRVRSPENVLEEIKGLINDYDITRINFEDDNFSLQKRRAEKICDLIIENDLNITWSLPNGIRADALDKSLVRKMALSGCRRVFVAPESGNQQVVTNIVKKKLDLKDVEKAVRMFKEEGIVVDGSFVIGMIGETRENILESVRYAGKLQRMGMSKVAFNIAIPLYGTELYKQAVENNALKDDFSSDDLFTNRAVMKSDEWTLEEVEELQRVGYWLINASAFRKVTNLGWLMLNGRWGELREKIKVWKYKWFDI